MSTYVDKQRVLLTDEIKSVKAELRVLKERAGSPFERLDFKSYMDETRRLLDRKTELAEQLAALDDSER